MKNDRVWGLDLIRAFAVISVLIIHTADLTPNHVDKYINLIRFDGVLYFFVLSGFLIGGILIRSFEKSFNFVDIINFWIRRWFRTLPNYFLFLGLLIFIFAEYKLRVIKYIFFVQNFYKPVPDFFPESWSLTVEEWFYLSLPLFILLLHKLFKFQIKNSVLIIIISAILISPIIRYFIMLKYNVNDWLSWDYHVRIIAICRFDSIIWGVLGAFLSYYFPKIWTENKIKLLVFSISAIVAVKLLEITYGWKLLESDSSIIMSLYLTIQSFFILCMLPFLSSFKIKRENVFTKSITKISLISYSMYLVNYSLVKGFILLKIENILKTHISTPYLTYILVTLFWIFSISIPLVIYKYYELPIMNMRDKIKFKKIKINVPN